MKLRTKDVVAYFDQLSMEELVNNAAIRAAGRAMVRLRGQTSSGPGRPPTVEHDPDNPGCRCRDCRRAFPSYQHKMYPAEPVTRKAKAKK